ncbi:MAG: putative toxin-antitoxin system toxin component, PIN family [Chloroflexia bacterium]
MLSKHSVVRQIFNLAIARGELLFSEVTRDELEEVIRRERFDKYQTRDAREQFIKDLSEVAILIEVTETITECRDPKDNKFLELAISGKADCIISGDRDLRVLHPFRGIPILTPQEFSNYSWIETS